MRAFSIELHVPKCFNDGRPAPPGVLAHVLERCTSAAGGATVFDAIGSWRDGREALSLVRCDFPEERESEARELALALALFVKRKLAQELVFVRFFHSEIQLS
jgi:hypothetical protein